MKTILIGFILLLSGCNEWVSYPPKVTYNQWELVEIASKCEGYGIVIRQGVDYSNVNLRPIFITLIRDDSNHYYEFWGTSYTLNVGDTINRVGKK